MPNIIYDIRTTEHAQQTLTNLTGVPISIWESSLHQECEYDYTDNFVIDVINKHGNIPRSYKDFEFVHFHVTTSANECASFRKHGILDLKQSYLCHDSELRQFLENHNIFIDLDERILKYCGKEFDINNDKECPMFDTEDYKCWSIGRKFYYDYTICGFLSQQEGSVYGGNVHRRPEILMDINNLLDLHLSREWASTHDSYEIVARVSGEKILCDCNKDDASEEYKVLHYLTKAYMTAFGELREEILLMKDDMQIPPMDILEINPMQYK